MRTPLFWCVLFAMVLAPSLSASWAQGRAAPAPVAKPPADTQPAAAGGKTYPLWDGKESQADYARRAGLDAEMTLDLGGGAKMTFVLIPAGKFMMGREGPAGVPGSPFPAHEVTISKPFYMSVTEVTQGQFATVMDANAVRKACFKRAVDMTWQEAVDIYKSQKKESKTDPNLPVDYADWNEAMEFRKKLSDKTGKWVCLPTESQWEYGCRAGTNTAHFFGDDLKMLGDYAWWVGNAKEHPAGVMPVGTRKPNPWGLYDMIGNAYEWTYDFPPIYPSEPTTDPVAPLVGRGYENRGLRGGAWGGFAAAQAGDMYRSDGRNSVHPEYKLDVLGRWKGRMPGAGFRVAIALEKPALLALPTTGPGTRPTAGPVRTIPEDFFPIVVWGAPPMAKVTDDAIRDLAECNFTLILGGGVAATCWDNVKMLDLCRKHGLMWAIAEDGFSHGDIRGPGFPGPWPKSEWGRRVQQVVDAYGSHPAFWGYYLADEPSGTAFGILGGITALLKEKDPHHPEIINLLPTYGVGLAGFPNYETYVDKFLQHVKPRILSYDNYPIQRGGVRPDFYQNMELIRDRALKAGIPFWGFALSWPHGSYTPPTEAEMAWEIYSLLAYGAKGVEYFLYWPPSGQPGIVDVNGKKSERYEPARRINAEVKALGPTLLKLTSTAVYHTGELPKSVRALEVNGVVDRLEGAQAIVGLFRDKDGNHYAMVVNKDYKQARTMKVGLGADVSKAEAFNCQTATWESANISPAKDFELSLAAGRGKLLRLGSSNR